MRAKAGALTVNLAQIGMVLTTIALDDRPGQTVYLRWRLGDYAFEELSAEEGRKLIAAVQLNPSAVTPRVLERETLVTDWIQSVVERARGGTVDYTALGSANAF